MAILWGILYFNGAIPAFSTIESTNHSAFEVHSFSSESNSIDHQQPRNGTTSQRRQRLRKPERLITEPSKHNISRDHRQRISKCVIPSNDHSANHFPAHLTVEQVMKQRSMNMDDIPMCNVRNQANHDQHQYLLSSLSTNWVKSVGRCKIRTARLNNRDFETMLSGDPIQSNGSIPIGFVHVYKGNDVYDSILCIRWIIHHSFDTMTQQRAGPRSNTRPNWLQPVLVNISGPDTEYELNLFSSIFVIEHQTADQLHCIFRDISGSSWPIYSHSAPFAILFRECCLPFSKYIAEGF